MNELNNLLEEAELDFRQDLEMQINSMLFFDTYFIHEELNNQGRSLSDIDTNEGGDIDILSSFKDIHEYINSRQKHYNIDIQDVVSAFTRLCDLGVIVAKLDPYTECESLIEHPLIITHLDYKKDLEMLVEMEIVKPID